MGYVYVAVTLGLTVYGQLIVKWRVDRAGHFPADLGGKASYLSGLLFDPWVLTALLGALIAALSWMAALTYLNLSRAYPFMGLSFGLVAIFSAIFFAEPLGALKVAGVLLVMFGIAVVSQS